MKQRKNTIDQKNIYSQKQGNFLKIIEKKFKIYEDYEMHEEIDDDENDII